MFLKKVEYAVSNNSIMILPSPPEQPKCLAIKIAMKQTSASPPPDPSTSRNFPIDPVALQTFGLEICSFGKLQTI